MRIVYKGNYIRMTCGEIGLVMVSKFHSGIINNSKRQENTIYTIVFAPINKRRSASFTDDGNAGVYKSSCMISSEATEVELETKSNEK